MLHIKKIKYYKNKQLEKQLRSSRIKYKIKVKKHKKGFTNKT